MGFVNVFLIQFELYSLEEDVVNLIQSGYYFFQIFLRNCVLQLVILMEN